MPEALPVSHLNVSMRLMPNVTVSDATVLLSVTVTGNSTPRSNVTVSFGSSGGGTFYPQTGATGLFGEFNTSFTAPTVTASTTIVISATATASGSGFTPGTASANLTVKPQGPRLVVTPSFPQGTTVHSGATDLVVARVTDGTGAPVANVNVTMAATVGTVTPSLAVSGASGNVTLTLHAPTVSVATQVWLVFVANASGYANASVASSVTVNTGVASSLQVTISPASGNLSAGGSVQIVVTVKALNTTGSLVAVAGANVTLILSDGTYSPSLAATGSDGNATFSYHGPSGLPRAENVTVTASAVATNYAPGSATGTYRVAPGPAPASASPIPILWIAVAAVAVLAVVAGLLIGLRRRKRPAPPPPSTPPPTPPA